MGKALICFLYYTGQFFVIFFVVPVVVLFMLTVCLAVQVVSLPFDIVVKLFSKKVQIFFPLVWWRYAILFGLFHWAYKNISNPLTTSVAKGVGVLED